MSEFEVVVFFVSLLFLLKSWGAWYGDVFTVNDFLVAPRQVFVLLTTPLFCLALLLVCLLTLAATTVRREFSYVAFYVVCGMAWLGGMKYVFPFLGISSRDDVLERGNVAACWATAGALLGSLCTFAGANIGNGPGCEVVLFSAVLSSALFFGVWLGLECGTRISETITVDRATGAGIRLGGFLVGVGILSGWSVAGNWVSARDTLKDFAISLWPAICIGELAILVERLRARTQFDDAEVGVSMLVATLYAGLALLWALARGVHS
ncbi:MAG: hypothetical protein ABSG16_04450 [Candidatus Acidiferrum sp.]